MSSFPSADDLLDAYDDQLEALERLFHAGGTVVRDSQSRFFGLSMPGLDARLSADREELELWVAMMLVASFEAMIQDDLKRRIKLRAKHPVRKPMRGLQIAHPDWIPLIDILEIWEAHVTVTSAIKQNVRLLLKHRHWLAHGRHWTNKHGALPQVYAARADLDDYVRALQATTQDFPLL